MKSYEIVRKFKNTGKGPAIINGVVLERGAILIVYRPKGKKTL